jgi:ABC-type branched-subunit amino acid transport system substrate-binding protein
VTSRAPARRVAVIAAATALALVLAACGSSSKSGAGATSTTGGTGATAAAGATTSPTAPQSKVLGPGVTATSVKVGVMLINYGCIKQFVDSIRENEQQTWNLYFDYINAHGGVAGGKKLVPDFKTYCPINNTGELAACTQFTDDDKVFAAMGTFYDPTGDAQLCFAKQHDTPIIADSLTQDLVGRAQGGLMVTPDITPDRRLRVIMSLLETEGTLTGKTVAVLGETTAKPRIEAVVDPALQSMGVKRGADASLTITGSDTTAAQQQLDAFIERWKTQGVNAVVLIGDAASSKQFIEKLKKEMPELLLVADTTSVLDGARDEQKAHVTPNPYDGIITAEGQTGLEHQQTPHGAFCRGIYEQATGLKMPSPNAVVKDAHGQRLDLYGQIEDACLYPEMFKQIADRVGPYLDAPNWADAVNHFGHIEDMSTIYASLHTGKYDADDTYSLVAYDPTIPVLGDWKRLSPIRDVGNA